MLWIHPLWQIIAIFIGFYVFYLGWARFAATSLGQKHPFQWKRHVNLGKLSLYMWGYGAVVGLAAAWVKWRAFRVTASHFWIGMIILLLVLFGYWSGQRMDTVKKKRKIIPLLHGANNLLILILSLISMATGISIIVKMVL